MFDISACSAGRVNQDFIVNGSSKTFSEKYVD